MLYIGIDPGKSGGIAAVDNFGVCVCAQRMPETDRELYNLFRDLSESMGVPVATKAVVEHVSSSPGMGVASAFKFGTNFGALRMALTAAKIPFDFVAPKTWTAAMEVSAPKGESGKFGAVDRKRRDKNLSKTEATRLFPRIKVTHAIAEALLIAEYARRLDRGTVARPSRKRAQSSEKALFQ
jgi:hypothetical protein